MFSQRFFLVPVASLLCLLTIRSPYVTAFTCTSLTSAGSVTSITSLSSAHDNEHHNLDSSSSTSAGNSLFSRRDAMSSSGAALASLLLGSAVVGSLPQAANAAADYVTEKQTVVITGANSGIGYDAACRMAARGHKIILACRTAAKANDTVDRIKSDLPESTVDLVPMECDLASLASISAFAKKLKPALGEGGSIDALCLNAGIARNTAATDVLRTADGFELTVGTNHLGHFYLNSLLLPSVKRGTGRIVVTASGVHDPDGPGGAQGEKATLRDLAGMEAGGNFEMIDGGAFNADKAYKDSKLCNVLFTRELQHRLDSSGSGIKANCFNPGLIVSTGFFRDQNPIFTKVFDIAATNIFKVGETPHYGGGTLEYMAISKDVGTKGGLFYSAEPGACKYGEEAYGKQFTITECSKEAKDDAKAKKLWELSEKLVGVSV